MICIVTVSSLVFPIVYLLQLPPMDQSTTVAVAFAVSVLVSTGVLFGPKLYLLMHGMDLEKDMKKVNNVARVGHPGDAGRNNSGRIHLNGDAPIAPIETADISEAIVFSSAAMAGKDLDEKSVLCMQQIEMWRAQLLKIGEETSGADSSRGSANSSVMITREVHESVGIIRERVLECYEEEPGPVELAALRDAPRTQGALFIPPGERKDDLQPSGIF